MSMYIAAFFIQSRCTLHSRALCHFIYICEKRIKKKRKTLRLRASNFIGVGDTAHVTRGIRKHIGQINY